MHGFHCALILNPKGRLSPLHSKGAPLETGLFLLAHHVHECTSISFFHFPKGNTASLTAWTTPVSNQLRSPRLRASVSVMIQKCAFALGIPSNI